MKANKDVSLTAREEAMLRGIAAGLTYQRIAVKHRLSYETVRFYVKRLRKKLKIRSKAGLAAWAVRNEVA